MDSADVIVQPTSNLISSHDGNPVPKDCVLQWCRDISNERDTLRQRLRHKVNELKKLISETGLALDDAELQLFEKYSEPSSPDDELEKNVERTFSSLMREVEDKAKDLEFPSSVDLSVQELIQQYVARFGPHRSKARQTPADRVALYEMIMQAKRERLNNLSGPTVLDHSHPPRRSHQSEYNTGRARRGRPPGSKTSWNLKRPTSNWPSSENGFFCLLRGFLTQGGERRRMTTAQLCEYVREWQTQAATKLQRSGAAWNWISRTDDWSSVTPHALQFLTGEPFPSTIPGSTSAMGLIRHSTRRLLCPRPFVDSRPRVHQWFWLLAPPGPDGQTVVADRFRHEAEELSELFAEWARAPRGLGGLADALWLTSTSASVGRSGRGKAVLKARGSASGKLNPGDNDGNDDDGDYPEDQEDEVDSDEDRRRLHIISDHSGSESEYAGGQKKGKRKIGRSRSNRSLTTHVLDDSIPPPLYSTSWRLRPFTEEQKRQFQMQEAERFSRPWSPFVYRIQDYACVVGPLRSAPSASTQRAPLVPRSYPVQSRAREHPLLRPDRPNFVSLAEIVRDAVACLPNGEGTRADITTLVQNSGYLLPVFDQRKLQQCVSSALDRLQGEAADPSVYFNVSRRMWIYRHRHRTADEFAELHEARCQVNEAKRSVQRGDTRTTSVPKQGIHHYTATEAAHLSSYSRARLPSLSGGAHFIPSRSGQHGSAHLQRHLGLGRADVRADDDSDRDDDLSDSHIPDIEELEAADMLREAAGGGGGGGQTSDLSDYSADSSSYDDDEDRTHHAYAYARPIKRGESDLEEEDDEAMQDEVEDDDELMLEPMAIDYMDRQMIANRQRTISSTVRSRGQINFPGRFNQPVGFPTTYSRPPGPPPSHMYRKF